MKKEQLSRLTLANCQIKSAEAFKEVCKAIDTIEKITFIRSGEIAFEDNFICPDFDLMPFYNGGDPTERLVARMCISLFVQKYKNAPQSYLDVMEAERQKPTARKCRKRSK